MSDRGRTAMSTVTARPVASVDTRLAEIEQRPHCVEWLTDDERAPRRCGARAEFILWGRLFPPDALGPRCYEHAERWTQLDAHTLSQSAVHDLRPARWLLSQLRDARAEIERLRARLAVAETEAATAKSNAVAALRLLEVNRAALAAVRELINEIAGQADYQIASDETAVNAVRVVAERFRAALAAAEQDEPKPACSTCDGSGAVLMEHQIGVPGSGGWISCPDCRPTPCVPVSQPTEGAAE